MTTQLSYSSNHRNWQQSFEIKMQQSASSFQTSQDILQPMISIKNEKKTELWTWFSVISNHRIWMPKTWTLILESADCLGWTTSSFRYNFFKQLPNKTRYRKYSAAPWRTKLGLQEKSEWTIADWRLASTTEDSTTSKQGLTFSSQSTLISSIGSSTVSTQRTVARSNPAHVSTVKSRHDSWRTHRSSSSFHKPLRTTDTSSVAKNRKSGFFMKTRFLCFRLQTARTKQKNHIIGNSDVWARF